jgi:hypothetical protein
MRQNSNQPAGLIQILLDGEAEFGARDDAAMCLGAFDENAAEDALARIACDEAADEDLVDSCGESLAEIWCRKGRVNREIFVRLAPIGRQIAIATMDALCPTISASSIEVSRNPQ